MPGPTPYKRVFTAAPHRMLFFGGAVQVLLAMGWWLFELLGRLPDSVVLTTIIPATWRRFYRA